MSYVHDVNYATNGKYWYLPNIAIRRLVLHSVGCAQPSADVFVRQFNTQSVAASVHGFLEPGRFVETAPIFQTPGIAKKCYHVGGSYNNDSIGIEMTEPATIRYTGGATYVDNNPAASKKHVQEVTQSAVELFADLCIFHNIPVSMITTHRQSYLDGGGSNHGDPEHIWKLTGYTLAQFRKDVQAMINIKKGDELANMTKQEVQTMIDTSI